jgi:transaldolase
MNPTRHLHDAGQSLWLDNMTRDLIQSGGLRRYIEEFSVTGLTSNPTIYQHALEKGNAYDASIREKRAAGLRGEALFQALELEDLTRAADLFRPVHDATGGVDGWVSLEVSPKLADDTQGTIAAAKELWARAARPNLFIKIPGNAAGLPAIEEATFAGVPINVTLLFSREQCLAAAEAYVRGLERRLAAGLTLNVASVISLFVSRWDVAIAEKVDPALRDRLGIAVARQTYKAFLELLASDRWLRLLNFGARPQRLLWASTGTKDPRSPELLYVDALFAPHTVNTLPEKTLLALAEHGELHAPLAHDGGDAEEVLGRFRRAGIDLQALADKLQRDGAAAFAKSWDSLLERLAEKAGVAAGPSRTSAQGI